MVKADHRVKMEEGKNIEKYLNFAKKAGKHEDDVNTYRC